jgi:hypothetical protein
MKIVDIVSPYVGVRTVLHLPLLVILSGFHPATVE